MKEGNAVEFRILGPVEVLADGKHHGLGSPRERCLLSILLWELGHPVTLETVMERLWGSERPAEARKTLYSLISRLRGHLREAGSDALVTRSGGWYRLQADRGNVDLWQFRELRKGARAAADANDNETY